MICNNCGARWLKAGTDAPPCEDYGQRWLAEGRKYTSWPPATDIAGIDVQTKLKPKETA